jgi:DNA-directed RNA polymerase subunit RPC12/RpoP
VSRKLNIPKYEGVDEPEERIEEHEIPGFMCMACKQTWRKEEDKDLRDKNDPKCPFCASKGVRKWKLKTRD